MPRRSTAWKAAERRVAGFFGTMRRPLSGAWGPGGRDDIIHSHLFVECKHYSKSAVMSLFQKTREKAIVEGKIPLLALSQYQGRGQNAGFLICFHSSNTADVFSQMCHQLESHVLLKLKRHISEILSDRPKLMPEKKRLRFKPARELL